MHYLGEVKNINCGKYIQDDKYKIYQNRPGFVDDVTKTFAVFFWFAVPIDVHLQNTNAKFHKVV